MLWRRGRWMLHLLHANHWPNLLHWPLDKMSQPQRAGLIQSGLLGSLLLFDKTAIYSSSN